MHAQYETTPANSSRIHALRAKHTALKEQIQEELKRPAMNDFFVRHLKKERLKIKELIVREQGT
jgi:hypothetical protein